MAKRRFGRARLGKILKDLGDEVRIVPKADRELRIISTGVDVLDAATGVGGYPLGRIVLHHGPPASGKTSAALHAVAEFQRQGGVAIYFDFERKMDFAYAEALGVDVDALVYPRASVQFIEQGFAAIEKVIEKLRLDAPDVPVLIVWDSMQSVPAMNEDKRGFEDTGYGGEAAAYSRCIRKINGLIADSGALLMFISQVRMDLGAPNPNAQRIGVGEAPLFFSTMCFLWKQVGGYGRLKAAAKGDSDRLGQLTEAEVRKNQVAPPFVRVRFPVVFGLGICRAGSLMEAAFILGRAEKTGAKSAWVVIDGGEEKPVRVQGVGGLRRILNEDPERFESIRQHILTPDEEAPDGEE